MFPSNAEKHPEAEQAAALMITPYLNALFIPLTSHAGSVLAAASEARPWSFVCYEFLQWLFSELLHDLFSLLSLQIGGFVDK